MDTLKRCLIVIVFSCLCSMMSNAFTSPTTTFTYTTTSYQVGYGANCYTMTQCYTTNAVCNEYRICACADTHYYDAAIDTCTEEAVYGASCYTTTQCNTTNAVCHGSGICVCADTHYYDAANDTCTQKAVYGASCYTTTQCSTTNAVCNGSGICVCADTHYYDAANDTCTQRQAFGGVCTDRTQCDTSDPNIECVQTTVSTEKRCLCKTGMYKPSATCTETSQLKPVITGTPIIGTGNIDNSWTNADVTGGYTFSYTVAWSPGSPGSAPTTQKSYKIQSLSPGTTYTVAVGHTITLHSRSQTITSDPRTFTTRIGYNESCLQPDLCYGSHTNCYSGRCRCDQGYYRNTDCVSINQLRPSTLTAVVQSTTTMTATWTAPSNAAVTGYEVSVTPGDMTPISVGRDSRTTSITGLTPGRVYTVNVKTKITYLQGRDEMTDAVSATPKRTTPASVVGLDVARTNRTAPDITIVFAKAAGDADRYIVTLRGLGGDPYNQQHQPPNTGQGPISVVFTGVVSAASYNLNIVTQSGNLQSLPYTDVIRVQSTPAGRVTSLRSFDNTSRSVAVEFRRPVNPNGQIFEYIVDVMMGSPSVCVKRIIINCTECSGNMTKMEIKCETTMTVVITDADIDNVAHVIQHNITGLSPGTPYTIGVVAVNEEGPGATGQIHIHTPMEAAGDPTNFKAQSRSSSEVTLTWDPPRPRPGVTQYNITVYEKQEDTESYSIVKTKSLSGWGINTYTIGNLSSYWFYKFDIVAETSIGASAIITSNPERTMESEPTGVLELKVEKITGAFNQVQVSWKCPKQKDGRNGVIVKANLNYFTKQQSTYVEPVRRNENFTNNGDCMWDVKVNVTTEFKCNFEVRLYNRGFAGSYVSVSKDIVGGGWGINTYTIGNLSSYWFYKFDIVAETSIGASAIITSNPERTMESEPTGVLELKVEKITGAFNQVQVSWKCPKQKDGKNGVIVKANLNYFTKQQSTYVEPVRRNENFTNNGDCMWDVKVNVTTEFKCNFEVRLYNRGFAGSYVSVSKDIVGGAPSQTAIMNSVRRGTGESETPPLLICPRCLNDRTNGQVNRTGLIVCRKENCGQAKNRDQATTAVDYDNMANWNTANEQDFGIPYRATKDDWLDGNVGKSSLHFTLGNEDCSGNTKNLFCNGKLPPGKTFIVYAFSCTNHGCTTSSRIEISTPAPVPVAAVVGGVIAAVVVILVVTGILIFLRRRKAHKERPKKSRDEVLANDQVPPEQDDVYERIPNGQMVTVDSSQCNGGYVNYVSGQFTRDTDNTYDKLAIYQNADGHDYGRINIETSFK